MNLEFYEVDVSIIGFTGTHEIGGITRKNGCGSRAPQGWSPHSSQPCMREGCTISLMYRTGEGWQKNFIWSMINWRSGQPYLMWCTITPASSRSCDRVEFIMWQEVNFDPWKQQGTEEIQILKDSHMKYFPLFFQNSFPDFYVVVKWNIFKGFKIIRKLYLLLYVRMSLSIWTPFYKDKCFFPELLSGSLVSVVFMGRCSRSGQVQSVSL